MSTLIHPAEAPAVRSIAIGWVPPAAWLALLAFALYLPPAARVVQLSPDAVEYVDVARRLLGGEGYQLGIKAYHVGETRVVHDGLAERPPLFPLLVAAMLWAGLGLSAVQVVNAGLAACSVALVCGIGSALFGRQVGVLSGLLAATSPVVLVRMVPPMSEALAISLLLAATWLIVRADHPSRRRDFVVAGLLLGLAYLARPTSAAIAPALAAGALLAAGDRQAGIRSSAQLGLGFAVAAVPMAVYSLLAKGSLSYSGQTYLYSVFKDADVLRNGYGRPIPSPAEFVSANGEFVVAAILDNVGEYARLLFLDPDWLRWLLPAWPLALLALVRGRHPRAAWPVLLAAAANFAIYALTWANYQERYQLLSLLLLLPFAVDGLGRLGLTRLVSGGRWRVSALQVAVLAVALAWAPAFVREYRGEFSYGDEAVRARSDRGVRWTGPPRWVEDNDLSRLVDWINGRTERHDALALGQPWPLTFFTQRPSTLLPTKLSAERLEAFIADYAVAYVVVDTRDRDRREYVDDLEALAARGVRSYAVGSYRVFETRAIWPPG